MNPKHHSSLISYVPQNKVRSIYSSLQSSSASENATSSADENTVRQGEVGPSTEVLKMKEIVKLERRKRDLEPATSI